jgi:hypothetical protein
VAWLLRIWNQRIAGPIFKGNGRASPVITLLSILLHDLEGAAIPPKAAWYGFKLCRFDSAHWQRGLVGGQLQPQGFLMEREEPTEAESLSQWSHPHDTESLSSLQVSQCH